MIRLAIAGDLHGQWDAHDEAILGRIRPDALLVVGDLSDGQTRIPRRLAALDLPLACILGNHDCGRDASGRTLQAQLDLLGSAIAAGAGASSIPRASRWWGPGPAPPAVGFTSPGPCRRCSDR